MDTKPQTSLDKRLMVAVRNGELSDVKAAVAEGANPRMGKDKLICEVMANKPNNLAGSNLKALENQQAILDFLVAQGCDVNAHNGEALRTAVHTENLAMVKALVEKYGADVDPPSAEDATTTRDLYTPASLSAHKKNNIILDILLNHGADPNQAFLTAVENADYSCVFSCIKAGADINQHDGEAMAIACFSKYLSADIRAKHLAKRHLDNQFKLIELLLENGANPYLKNRAFDSLLRLPGERMSYNWVADRIISYIDERLSQTHPLPDSFFEGADLTALRKKGKINAMHASGLVHAARAGQFQKVVNTALADTSDTPDNRKFYPMDMLYMDDQGFCVLDYLAARKELSLAFTPALWKGKLKEAQALYDMLAKPHKAQINLDLLRLDISYETKGKTTPVISRRRPK